MGNSSTTGLSVNYAFKPTTSTGISRNYTDSLTTLAYIPALTAEGHAHRRLIEEFLMPYNPLNTLKTFLNMSKGNTGKFVSESIEKVIFNDPCTIVLWKDNTKTVVKCNEGDTYNKEAGLSACIIKKLCGNKGNFNDIFREFCGE